MDKFGVRLPIGPPKLIKSSMSSLRKNIEALMLAGALAIGFLLFAVVLGIIAPARGAILFDAKQFVYLLLVVALVTILQIIISIWFGRTHKEDVTWLIVSTFKNSTLSSVIAMSIFGSQALLGSVAYIIIGNLVLIPISIFSKAKA